MSQALSTGGAVSPAPAGKEDIRRHYLKQFLKFLWLRPENALLLAVRADCYRSTLGFFGDGKGSIDVSCGDGIFSFIALGGELSAAADKFRAVNTDKTFREGNFDTFDHYDDSYDLKVTRQPEKHYEFGTDWKDNLLKKAARLNFYSNLKLHDNNNPLPYGDGSMSYVYSNSAYWVSKFKEHLQDLARVTKRGGHVVLEMKTTNIVNYTSRHYLPFMGERFHQIIDAGRLSTWKGLRSKEEILGILEQVKGLKIKTVKPVYGGTLGVIWDVGLRPLYTPLVKMANQLKESNRQAIKDEWCQILYELFSDLILKYEADDKSAIEHLIVMEKQ
jgi:hypothetical protein